MSRKTTTLADLAYLGFHPVDPMEMSINSERQRASPTLKLCSRPVGSSKCWGGKCHNTLVAADISPITLLVSTHGSPRIFPNDKAFGYQSPVLLEGSCPATTLYGLLWFLHKERSIEPRRTCQEEGVLALWALSRRLSSKTASCMETCRHARIPFLGLAVLSWLPEWK